MEGCVAGEGYCAGRCRIGRYLHGEGSTKVDGVGKVDARAERQRRHRLDVSAVGSQGRAVPRHQRALVDEGSAVVSALVGEHDGAGAILAPSSSGSAIGDPLNSESSAVDVNRIGKSQGQLANPGIA